VKKIVSFVIFEPSLQLLNTNLTTTIIIISQSLD